MRLMGDYALFLPESIQTGRYDLSQVMPEIVTRFLGIIIRANFSLLVGM